MPVGCWPAWPAGRTINHTLADGGSDHSQAIQANSGPIRSKKETPMLGGSALDPDISVWTTSALERQPLAVPWFLARGPEPSPPLALTQLSAPDTELTINVGTLVETISYLLHSESISPAAHNLQPCPPLRLLSLSAVWSAASAVCCYRAPESAGRSEVWTISASSPHSFRSRLSLTLKRSNRDTAQLAQKAGGLGHRRPCKIPTSSREDRNSAGIMLMLTFAIMQLPAEIGFFLLLLSG